MSPILIRPVREQIEHDRIIRVLQARLRKDYSVEANLGDERRVPVRVGEQVFYPDLVLTSLGSSKKVQTIIEVETTESVNHLEAMAEWAHYGKARAPFHLYVPAGLVEIARRLIENYHISVAQLWSYSPVGDQVHFWLVSGDGDGTIIASVTDSISAAEPVRPVAPEPVATPEPDEVAPTEDEPPTAAEPAAGDGARPARPAAKAATKPSAKPAAAPAPKGKPAPAAKAVAKPAAAPKPAVPARPAASAKALKPAAKPRRAAAKPAAKAPARPATKPAAKAVKKTPTAKKPAAPVRKPAAKPASRPATRKATRKATKPAAKARKR